jgi:hypothetical protein
MLIPGRAGANFLFEGNTLPMRPGSTSGRGWPRNLCNSSEVSDNCSDNRQNISRRMPGRSIGETELQGITSPFLRIRFSVEADSGGLPMVVSFVVTIPCRRAARRRCVAGTCSRIVEFLQTSRPLLTLITFVHPSSSTVKLPGRMLKNVHSVIIWDG